MSDVLACLEMGNVFHAEGNYPAAADAYQRAGDMDPSFARNYYCQANLDRDLGKHAESLSNYNKAIALDASIADFYNNRGLLKYEMFDIDGSKADFLQAIKLNPKDALFINNLGVLYQCMNKLDHARGCFERAISIDPEYKSSYCNLGVIHSALGDQVKAIEYYDQLIALDPDYADAHNSKCLSLLTLGKYEEGWKVHEWRWKTNYKPFPRGLPTGELWNGKDSLAGKSILIQSEQGFGDIIQFCRYLPLLEQMGATIVFRTEKLAMEVLRSLPVKMQMIAMDEEAPPTDYYFPILSLPLAFNTTLENIPNQFPYLSADPKKSAAWKSQISLDGDNRLRVGLVWAGAPRPQKLNYRNLNSRRDIALERLASILNALKNEAVFYSLQKGGLAQQQLLESPLKDQIIDLTNELNDFSDTAALINNLNLVISVDTSTAHLAAAMDKPVFLLNRRDTCWRWLEFGSTSPWYPSITIFRQSEMLVWDDVIANVINALRAFSKEAQQQRPHKIHS